MAAVGVVFSVATATRADAGDMLPFELAWDAPASCPDVSFVRHRVEQIVRAPPMERTVVVGNAKIDAAAGGGFRLVLTLRTGDVEETKTITAASCSSLAQATATILALAIESPASPAGSEHRVVPPTGRAELERGAPSAPSAPLPQEPERAAVVNSPAPSPRPSSTAPTSVPPQPSWSVAPGAFMSIDTATLPAVAAGFGLSAALRLHRFRVGVLGTFSLPQSSSFSKTARVSFDRIEGGAWGAYVVPLGNGVSLGPSAELGATFVRVQGFGLRAPRETWTVWPSIATGGRLEAHVTRWLSFVARAELLFHVGAPRFSLATVEEPLRLHDPGSPAVRLSAGAEIVIP